MHMTCAHELVADLQNYNDKPVLTRPQHTFYTGADYFEIDLNIHGYAYVARKAFGAFIPRLPTAVFENAFVIQGNRYCWSLSDAGTCLGLSHIGNCPHCLSSIFQLSQQDNSLSRFAVIIQLTWHQRHLAGISVQHNHGAEYEQQYTHSQSH